MKAVISILDEGALEALSLAANNSSGKIGLLVIRAGEDVQQAVIKLSVILRKPLDELLGYLVGYFSSALPGYGVAVLYRRPTP